MKKLNRTNLSWHFRWIVTHNISSLAAKSDTLRYVNIPKQTFTVKRLQENADIFSSHKRTGKKNTLSVGLQIFPLFSPVENLILESGSSQFTIKQDVCPTGMGRLSYRLETSIGKWGKFSLPTAAVWLIKSQLSGVFFSAAGNICSSWCGRF